MTHRLCLGKTGLLSFWVPQSGRPDSVLVEGQPCSQGPSVAPVTSGLVPPPHCPARRPLACLGGCTSGVRLLRALVAPLAAQRTCYPSLGQPPPPPWCHHATLPQGAPAGQRPPPKGSRPVFCGVAGGRPGVRAQPGSCPPPASGAPCCPLVSTCLRRPPERLWAASLGSGTRFL